MTTDLPGSWIQIELGALLAGIQAGRSFRAENRPPSGDQVGVAKVSAVTWGVYQEDESKTVLDPDKVNPDFFVRPGDFLFSRANTIELVGAAVIAATVTKRVMLSDDKTLRFRFKAPVDRWVLHALRSYLGRAEIERLATGNQDSMRNIGQKRIRQIRIPLAPLPEQHRIVAEIETQFTRLDAAVATLKRVKANLARARASVLKSAVEGRLVPTEAALAAQGKSTRGDTEGPEWEPASVLLDRILAERRRRHDEAQVEAKRNKKYKEPVKPDTAGLPALPGGWVWATIDAVTEVQSGLAKGKKRSPGEVTHQTPYLRVANVQRGWLDLDVMKTMAATDDEIAHLQLEPGDVLFNEGGDRDKLGRGWVWAGQVDGCIHQNHVFRARPVTADIRPKFLSYYGNSNGRRYFIEQGKQTTNLASINQTKLRALPVPIPPLAEQHRIVAEVDRRLSVLDALVHTLDTNLARCARLRQSILKHAFEGKLVPQDPTDEPADKLLVRIQGQEGG